MKKFASSRSLNKILAQCDSSSREYEEIQAVERKWHLHLATPRRLLLDRRAKASLFFAAPPPPKRAPSTTLTLRSKSMTAELEELGEHCVWTVGGWSVVGWPKWNGHRQFGRVVVLNWGSGQVETRRKNKQMVARTDQQLGYGLEGYGETGYLCGEERGSE